MVDILLSTFNGRAYIPDLLKSLQSQTFTEWRLIVRDDGSADETLLMLKHFKETHPKKIIIIDEKINNLGPMRSFEQLMEYSSAQYIMFCDQDDVWLPHKIEESLACIQQLEQKNPDKAALVFSDLEVVDEHLNTINSSFWSYSKVNPDNVYNCYKLLINNPAPGCTFIMNRRVKPLVLPFPEQARMHDWWIILKVAESGIIDYIKKPGLLYRQHKKNKVGAEAIKNTYLLTRMANFSLTIKRNKESYQMMKCLSNEYSLLKLLYYKMRISLAKLL